MRFQPRRESFPFHKQQHKRYEIRGARRAAGSRLRDGPHLSGQRAQQVLQPRGEPVEERHQPGMELREPRRGRRANKGLCEVRRADTIRA